MKDYIPADSPEYERFRGVGGKASPIRDYIPQEELDRKRADRAEEAEKPKEHTRPADQLKECPHCHGQFKAAGLAAHIRLAHKDKPGQPEKPGRPEQNDDNPETETPKGEVKDVTATDGGQGNA